MKKENRNKLLLMLAVLVLVMLACADLTVTNNADFPVRITVTMPSAVGPETVMLDGNGSEAFTSDNGGVYWLTAIADEAYRAELQGIRDEMTLVLFGGGLVLWVQPEINDFTTKINNISKLLENMETVSCSGKIDEGNAASATVSFNEAKGILIVNCGSTGD